MKRVLLILSLFFLSACGGVTYPDEKVLESLDSILLDEYSIDNVQTARNENSLWLHVPVKKIHTEDYEFDEETLDKINNVSLSATRILLSTDADIDFLCIFIKDEDALEFRIIRHIKDIEKARIWYISSEELQDRSEMSMDFDPSAYGKKALRQLAGAGEDKARGFIIPSKAHELAGRIPPFDEIKEMKARRIDDDRALVYVETEKENPFLFLVDAQYSSSFDDLLGLLQPLLSEEEKEFFPDEDTFPVIADFYELKEGMPDEYENMGKPSSWDHKEVYSRPVFLEDFVESQIKRKISDKFDENHYDWDIEIQDLEVAWSGEAIRVTRSFNEGSNPLFDVDADYEIILAVSQAVKNYDIDINKLIILKNIWNTVKEVSRDELLSAKPKKWRRIRQKNEKSSAETINSLFMFDYDE